MKQGTRAILFAVYLVTVAAALTLLLKDGSIFTVAASTASLGKFFYDGARDFKKPPDNA